MPIGALVLAVLLWGVASSLNDPHKFPDVGPFVEGWYVRLIDDASRHSFGILFGTALPKTGTPGPAAAAHPVLLGLLHSRGDDQPMESFAVFPAPEATAITARGRPVRRDPDARSPADFEWRAEPYGYFRVRGDRTEFNFTGVDGVDFSGELGPPQAWGPHGEGPEGWLDDLPLLPLHWFVYSLGSPVHRYRWSRAAAGQVLVGRSGVAHQEKNWGEGFPPAWVWAQGRDLDSGAAFALSIGVLDVLRLDVRAHLIGYRSAAARLTFRPTDSLLDMSHDGCSGRVNVTVTGLTHRLVAELHTPPAALQTCLLGPTGIGFVPVCVEGYNSGGVFHVYELGVLGPKLIETTVFSRCALEFGGQYICPGDNPCKTHRNAVCREAPCGGAESEW